MEKYCIEHPYTEALSVCHGCGLDYCEECLSEGKEYYYCKKPECLKLLKEELGDDQLQSPEVPHDDNVNLIEIYHSRNDAKTAVLKSIFDNANIQYCTYGENYRKGVAFLVNENQIKEVKEIIKAFESE